MHQAIQPPRPWPMTTASFSPRARMTLADVERRHVGVVAARRLVGPAVAAEVHRGDAVAGVGEGDHLVAPRVPELREAVEHEHQRPVARSRRRGSGRRWRRRSGAPTGPSMLTKAASTDMGAVRGVRVRRRGTGPACWARSRCSTTRPAWLRSEPVRRRAGGREVLAVPRGARCRDRGARVLGRRLERRDRLLRLGDRLLRRRVDGLHLPHAELGRARPATSSMKTVTMRKLSQRGRPSAWMPSAIVVKMK